MTTVSVAFVSLNFSFSPASVEFDTMTGFVYLSLNSGGFSGTAQFVVGSNMLWQGV